MLGNLHMFEHELYKQRPAFLTEEDYKRYDAHIAFMEAYYHFKLLNWFGPCPIHGPPLRYRRDFGPVPGSLTLRLC